MTAPPYQGDVLIRAGKICALGGDLANPDAQCIDVSGYTVIPGLVDAHCHIGLAESGVGEPGQDVNEHTDPLLPELRAVDALNPDDDAFREAREAGITTCVTGPGSSGLITGTFCAVKTWGATVEEMLLRESLAMKMALGENPKQAFGVARKTAPETRMSEMSQLRNILQEARIYADKRAKCPDMAAWNMKLEALSPVVRGEMPVKFHVHRKDDIASALRIARELSLRISLDHCTEGYLMLPVLQAAARELDLRVVLGPLMMPRRKIETRNLSPAGAAKMHEAGIRFGLMSDHPVTPGQYLNLYAGLAAREGLAPDAALAAVTIDAAYSGWIDDRVGSLEVGKDADIAVFNGEPLQLGAKCVMTVIDGKIVYRRTAA